jgi:hypothetical protein
MFPQQQVMGAGENRVDGAGDAGSQPAGDVWRDDAVRAAVDDLGRGRDVGQPHRQAIQLDEQGALLDHEGAPHGRPGPCPGQSGEHVQRLPGAPAQASLCDRPHPLAGEQPAGETQGERRQRLTDKRGGEQAVLPAEALSGSDGGREHQAGGPVGKEPGEGEGHPAAPAVAHEQRPLHGEAVQQVSQGDRILGETPRGAGRATVSRPVGDDRRELVTYQRDDVMPVERRAGLAVQEHDRRSVAVPVRPHRPPARHRSRPATVRCERGDPHGWFIRW